MQQTCSENHNNDFGNDRLWTSSTCKDINTINENISNKTGAAELFIITPSMIIYMYLQMFTAFPYCSALFVLNSIR